MTKRFATALVALTLGGLLLAARSPRAAPQEPAFVPLDPEQFAAGGTLVNAWADVDRDQRLDLFVGFNGAPNRLYRNEGGRFVEVGERWGIADPRPTRAAAWGDFDADGDPDLLVGFAPGAGPVLRLYRNEGSRFADRSELLGPPLDGAAVRQPVWVDFDGDGDLDLFVAFRDRPNALFEQTPAGFREIAGSVGLDDPRKSVGAVWLDADQDGDLDLALANMDGDRNALWRNDGDRFVDVADPVIAWAGRGDDPAHGTVRFCAADVNADGRLDLFAANYGPNGLLLARPGGFEDRSGDWGIAIDGRYDSCAFADFDHDGRLDLFVNGTVTGGVSYREYLFRQAGGAMSDVTPPVLLGLHADHGVQWVDVDQDGDLDLSLTGVRPDGTHGILLNQLAPATARRSLFLRITDARGRATRAGAEVRVYRAGGGALLATGLVDAGSGYDSQSDLPVHFGLPGMDPVDVAVIYPRRGRRDPVWLRGLAPGSVIRLRIPD
ncbi:MAG: CRTAC1 family protein [Gemmatimonadales bacterium]